MIAKTSALLLLAFAFIGQRNGNNVSRSQPNSVSTANGATDFLDERLVLLSDSARPICEAVYPLPRNYETWTNCKSDGEPSSCGGPDQCSCDESKRLVTFACDQGTYRECWGERYNGCPGQPSQSAPARWSCTPVNGEQDQKTDTCRCQGRGSNGRQYRSHRSGPLKSDCSGRALVRQTNLIVSPTPPLIRRFLRQEGLG